MGTVVCKTRLGLVRVSTVFLGLDHNWTPGQRPLVFETLVFGGPADGMMERYSTWEEAEAGHEVIVALVRAFHGSWVLWIGWLWRKLTRTRGSWSLRKVLSR